MQTENLFEGTSLVFLRFLSFESDVVVLEPKEAADQIKVELYMQEHYIE